MASKVLSKASDSSDMLQEPLLSDQDSLKEASETVQALVEQMKDTLKKRD